jgi:hypothetical protein
MFTAIRTILLALIVVAAPLPAAADDLEEFAVAVERAELQYRIALRTLETAGRDETTAEVALFREAWQEVIARLDNHRPVQFEDDDSYAATMMEVDTALVGAMIVISISSREGARAALMPIGEKLAKLRDRVERR